MAGVVPIAVVAALSFAFFARAPSAATAEIGDTVAVKSVVTAEIGEEKRKLSKGVKVFQDEVLATSKTASAEIEFLDKTKLAVGPSARIILDKFIYDASAAPGSIAINLSKGAFRFITGSSPKTAYEIKTPTATLGVRGTIFDVFVADDGQTAVLLHEGGVDVCPTPASCRRHDTVGHIMHVGLDRVVTSLLRWDGSILKGIGVATAFPFVGKRLVIDPVRRMRYSTLLKGGPGGVMTAPARQLRDIGRKVRPPRLPF